MLTINNVTISIQNFTTAYAVFLTGPSKKSIEERYYSFYNFGACQGDLDWWSDSCAMFWIYGHNKKTAEEWLKASLWKAALAEILQSTSTKGRNPLPEAIKIAQDRYNLIDRVRWMNFDVNLSLHSLGNSVKAEKETGDFSDVLTGVVSNGKSSLEAFNKKNEDDSNSD